MKELTLTFDYDNDRIYKECLFKYNNHSLYNKYLLTYQIDCVAFNIEYFKDLVYFSKKATRSSLISDYLSLTHIEDLEIKDNTLFIYGNKPLRLLPVNNIIAHRTNISFIRLPYYLIKYSKDYYTNFYENLITDKINDDNISYIENIYLHRSSYIATINDIYLLKNKYPNFLRLYENLLLYKFNIKEHLNVFENLFLYEELSLNEYKRDMYRAQLFKSVDIYNYNFYDSNKHRILKLYDNTSTKFFYANLNLFNEYHFLRSNYKHINRLEDISLKNIFNININLFDIDFANGNYINIFINDLNLGKKFAQYDLSLYENVHGLPLYYNFLNINSIDFGQDNGKVTWYEDLYDFFKDKYRPLSEFNNILGSNDTNKILDADKFILDFLDKKHTYTFIINQFFINKSLNKKIYYEQDNFYVKNNKFIRYDNVSLLFINKYNDSINLFNNIVFYDKYKKLLPKFVPEIYIDKFKKDFSIYGFNKLYDFLNKAKPELYINKYNLFVNKSKYSFDIYKNNLYLNKFYSYLNISDNDEHIYLYKSYFNIPDSVYNDRIYKLFKNIQYEFFSDFALHSYRNVFENYNNIFLYKEYKNLNDYAYYNSDAIKLLILTSLYTDNKNIIISVNKVNHSSFMYDFIDKIHKRHNETKYFNTSINFASKNRIPAFFGEHSLLCDKLSNSANFMNLIEVFGIKSRLSTWFITDDSFIYKTSNKASFQENINIFRKDKRAFINETLNVYRLVKELFINDNINVFRQIKELNVNNILSLKRRNLDFNIFSQEHLSIIKYAFLHQDDFVDRTIFGLSYQKENLFGAIEKLSYKDKTEEFLSIEKHIGINQIEEMTRPKNQVNFYDQYVLDKATLARFLPEFNDIHKIYKEMNYTIKTETDFAWVYEEEEGFNDPFKIDELLLPENDTKYENFEDILFNRKTLKPRNPVKIIDDYTFIAKYPNQYPIKNDERENAYKDIALDYLEVRTSIMRQVFIGYYKVWQDHIFEFSRMTMNQSANKILDYLYVWILMYFPEEDIPEALRVFKQVRWYLERSIIECSEYYITYEPSDLKSGPMNTTKIPIPSDLDDNPANDKMFVDTNLHVIRNNPNQLRQETYITFYIDNKRDTTISFSLNTFDPVYIMLNDEIIDNITVPTQSKMVYNIPYTGDVNNFRIGKLGIDNNDNYFYIGNIIIAGMGNDGNLNIEFNPKIQGNKVLNHVSRKVIEYMNLYNDNETLMKNLVKGNVHFSELYEKLLEYWENHWERKNKGKRWTIKRT